MRRRYALVAFLAMALAASTGAEQRFSRQDADRFDVKLNRIVQYGYAVPRQKPAPRATDITDAELNAYLRYHAKDQIPVGIVDPTIHALGNGRVAGRAVVDLDAVRKQKPRGWTDPMGYLTGRLPVAATGTLTTTAGVGRFTLESAEISGVAVPKGLLQELVSHYSRTPENPAGINMDEPFELPARIREIRVGEARATILQQ